MQDLPTMVYKLDTLPAGSARALKRKMELAWINAGHHKAAGEEDGEGI